MNAPTTPPVVPIRTYAKVRRHSRARSTEIQHARQGSLDRLEASLRTMIASLEIEAASRPGATALAPHRHSFAEGLRAAIELVGTERRSTVLDNISPPTPFQSVFRRVFSSGQGWYWSGRLWGKTVSVHFDHRYKAGPVVARFEAFDDRGVPTSLTEPERELLTVLVGQAVPWEKTVVALPREQRA